MAEVNLFTIEGENKGKLSISDEVFAVEPNLAVMNQALLRQLANARRGSASTKTRAEVAGGGRKPWKQKGTGRSRHGSIRSPLWRGGGITFGPKPRDYSQDMPKRMRRLALKGALSDKLFNGKFFALDSLQMEEPKTKKFIRIMDNLKLEGKVLFIIKDKDFAVQKSAGNIPAIRVITTDEINIFDLLKYDQLIMTEDAIRRVEEVLI